MDSGDTDKVGETGDSGEYVKFGKFGGSGEFRDYGDFGDSGESGDFGNSADFIYLPSLNTLTHFFSEENFFHPIFWPSNGIRIVVAIFHFATLRRKPCTAAELNFEGCGRIANHFISCWTSTFAQ